MKNIDFKYDNRLKVPIDISIDIGRTNKLYLAMKEVVNNSVKYSEAQHASIKVSSQPTRLQIIIEDDGIGFDPDHVGSRNGIKNLKQFSQQGFY